MRATEFTETINPKVFARGFEQTKEHGVYELVATPGEMPYIPGKKARASDQFRIEARLGSVVVGWVNFKVTNNRLEAIDLVVNDEHQRKGIATAMYKFAQELGNDIMRSTMQTGDGRAFWASGKIQEDTGFISDVSQYAQMLIRDCGPFLQSGGLELPLYRGLRLADVKAPDYPMRVHKNRRPKDSSIRLHDAFNGYLHEKFGIKYRSQAVFASGDSDEAASYGRLMTIFPIGNFDYCWSPMVKDLYNDLPYKIEDLLNTANPRAIEVLNQWLDENHYRHNVSMADFGQAIMSKNEIMIHCDNYYALPYGSWDMIMGQVKKELGVSNAS